MLHRNSGAAAAPASPDDVSVSVVVTTYDHAHYLGDALASIAAQTRSATEVIVVDDGSHDDPAAVVARFPGVRLLRQDNAGLSAARNAGLAATTGRFVLFLDADDVLAPRAIAAGLAAMAANPGAALVYGGHRRVDARLAPIGGRHLVRCGVQPLRGLLGVNIIGMHATVLYDRAVLVAEGGFDPALRSCEDYDVFLRLARRHRIACHGETVADYRWLDSNMSGNAPAMLDWALRVHARHRPAQDRPDLLEDWRRGRRAWQRTYCDMAWRARPGLSFAGRWRQRLGMTAKAPLSSIPSALRQTLRRVLPAGAVHRLRRIAGRTDAPLPGKVDFGDLARITPISANFGYDRGSPIDRHYIEDFLARHAADIAGRALEIGDDAYCRQFGRGITRQDVLHVDAQAPGATITGDLSQPGVLPDSAFDCMIVTQTLHLIWEPRAALERMARALRPGGVLLLTAPGLSPIDPGEWGKDWLWSFTPQSMRRMMAEAFGEDGFTLEAHGNAFAATAFLQGIALEEVDPQWLAPVDPNYPVILAVRAVRGGDA